MKALTVFSIPIKGLGIGKHSFEYNIEDKFFSFFEGSGIQEGNYHVILSSISN